MIKFENTKEWGFEHSLRGMRNPMNSWDKSDSFYSCDRKSTHRVVSAPCKECWYLFECTASFRSYIIGENDLSLAQKLILAGTEHDKFMRQIFVSVDITAPLYWWKEFDTYKVGTVANSCSTMHKIQEKEFVLDDFSCEHLINEPLVESEPVVVDKFNLQAKNMLEITITILNAARLMYLKTKDKRYWWQMIQLLPSSYNQKRTCTMNYENLRSMYFQRRNHKLDEWSVGFINWIESLPYAKELIMVEKK